MSVEIITGDSAAVLPSLSLFDLVVTDPPYTGTSGGPYGRASKRGATFASRRRGGTPRLREYDMTSSVVAIVSEAARHVRPGGRMVVFCGSTGRSMLPMLAAVEPSGLALARVLPWIKPATKDGAVGPFGWQTVLALVFGKCGGMPRAEDYCIADRYHRRGAVRGEHPAEMPANVGRWIARALADPGMSVLDPFLGTGALLQGFAEHGCDVTGIEIDPRWAALARDRLAAVATPTALPWALAL